jgi:hypothetical protein
VRGPQSPNRSSHFHARGQLSRFCRNSTHTISDISRAGRPRAQRPIPLTEHVNSSRRGLARYSPRTTKDQKVQAEVLSTYVQNGILSINQIREKLDEQPDPNPAANQLMAMTPNGYVPVGTTKSEQGVEQ